MEQFGLGRILQTLEEIITPSYENQNKAKEGFSHFRFSEGFVNNYNWLCHLALNSLILASLIGLRSGSTSL